MAERFGSQTHPSGGQRFGSQTYAAVNAAAGDLAVVETGVDVFAAEAQPSVNGSLTAVETDGDQFASSGVSSLSQTMQAFESGVDTLIATGQVIEASSVRFGDQDHPLGGLRFGIQSWAALGPNGPMIASESGSDTVAAEGWLVPTGYQYADFEILASFVNYTDESLGAAIAGTLDDGYKVLLPVSGPGLSFTWETNAFGNPSLRLSNLAGATVVEDVPWFVWDGLAWTAASFDVSDAMQGAVFMVESGVDTFIGNGSNIVFGSVALVETEEDFVEIFGGVAIAGAAAAAETGADTFASDGAPSYEGFADIVEADEADAFVADGFIEAAGSLDAVESGGDTFAAVGGLDNSGAMAAIESGADVLAAAGALSSAGSMAATEAATADTLVGAGAVVVAGAALLLEAGADSMAAAGLLAKLGTLAAVETGADAFAAAGLLGRIGALSVAETGADVFASAGAVAIAGDVAAVELQADRFAGTGVVPIEGDAIIGEASLIDGGADRFVARGYIGDHEPLPTFDGPVITTSTTRAYSIQSRRTAEAA